MGEQSVFAGKVTQKGSEPLASSSPASWTGSPGLWSPGPGPAVRDALGWNSCPVSQGPEGNGARLPNSFQIAVSGVDSLWAAGAFPFLLEEMAFPVNLA